MFNEYDWFIDVTCSHEVDLENLENSKSLEFDKLKFEYNKHHTNHILHLLLSASTIGLWAIAWFFISTTNSSERNKIDDQMKSL